MQKGVGPYIKCGAKIAKRKEKRCTNAQLVRVANPKSPSTDMYSKMLESKTDFWSVQVVAKMAIHQKIVKNIAAACANRRKGTRNFHRVLYRISSERKAKN